MRRRGIPRKLYVDNGPSFRAHRLQLGCAALEIGLKYARPYRPQGKGKIERYFRTVRMQFLPELTEDLGLDKLNELFSVYLEQRYHKRIHGSTGQTPMDRYLKDVKALRKAPENLPEYFRKQETRKVNNDRTIQLHGKLYEAPAGLVGIKVILRYEEFDRIEVFVDDASKGFLRDLNQEVNSRVGRDPSTPGASAVSGGQLFERNKGVF